jgi:heptosyltransferase-1
MQSAFVKTSSLGDIVQCYPALHFLKDRYPDAEVTWVVKQRCKALVESHPLVDNVVEIDSRKLRNAPFSEWRAQRRLLGDHRFNLLFDFQGNSKSAFCTWALRADRKIGFGRKTVSEWPNLLVTHERWDPPPGKNIREDYLHLLRAHSGDDAQFEDKGVLLNTPPQEQELVRSLVPDHPALLLCPGSNWKNKRLPDDILRAELRAFPDHRVLVS